MLVVVGLAALLRLEAIDQFPPGLSRDEAQAVTLPYFSAVSRAFPLFETEEPEPLHRALLTLLFPLTEGNVTASRTVQALIGVVTVAAAYWAAWQWLADLSPSARHVGALVAAGGLAVALGHITLSRSLYRGLLQALFMFGMLGFLARGMRLGRWRDFALTGALAALAILTYTAAYVLPRRLAALGGRCSSVSRANGGAGCRVWAWWRCWPGCCCCQCCGGSSPSQSRSWGGRGPLPLVRSTGGASRRGCWRSCSWLATRTHSTTWLKRP